MTIINQFFVRCATKMTFKIILILIFSQNFLNSLVLSLKSDQIGDCLYSPHNLDGNITFVCFSNVFPTEILSESNFTECRNYHHVNKQTIEVVAFLNCKMKHLPSNIFKKYLYIEELDVSNLGLNEIEPEIFRQIVYVKNVTAPHNNLTQVPIIPHTNQVEILDLSSNPLKQLAPNAFSHLIKLECIYLMNTSISEIQSFTFNYQRNLKIVDLSNNHIKSIDMTLFIQSFYSLDTIYLDRNELTELDSVPRELFQHLNVFTVNGNGIGCDYLRDFFSLNGWKDALILSRKTNQTHFYQIFSKDETLCQIN